MGGFSVMKVVRALMARLIFALHSCIALWRLYMEDQDMFYWLFGLIPILLFIEGAVTILLRNGDEYKWFCPCVFIYLCGSIPPIWFLELTNTRNYISNYTRSEVTNEYINIGSNMKVNLPRIPRQYWLQVVEQSLLIVVIIGRWILPKGVITRDQLSQLLLAYLAISSDIVELFDLFNERAVRGSMKLSLVVLSVWSVALIQFPMVMTSVKGQKARHTFTEEEELQEPEEPYMVNLKLSVWGILSTVLLQDGPFLGLRLYLIFWHRVMSYTMVFFVCKNSLIVSLQLYRLMVICCDKNAAKKRRARTATPTAQSKSSRVESVRLLDPENGSVGKNSAKLAPNGGSSPKCPSQKSHHPLSVDKSLQSFNASDTPSLASKKQSKTNSMICSVENYDDLLM